MKREYSLRARFFWRLGIENKENSDPATKQLARLADKKQQQIQQFKDDLTYLKNAANKFAKRTHDNTKYVTQNQVGKQTGETLRLFINKQLNEAGIKTKEL